MVERALLRTLGAGKDEFFNLSQLPACKADDMQTSRQIYSEPHCEGRRSDSDVKESLGKSLCRQLAFALFELQNTVAKVLRNGLGSFFLGVEASLNG